MKPASVLAQVGSVVAMAVITGVLSGPALQAATPDTGSNPVRVTVTVSSRNHQMPPTLTARDVMVFANNQRRPVLDLEPLVGSAQGSDLAILIDGSLGSAVTLQFPDLRSFIGSLPASTQVGVAYAEYGSARFTQNFTGDREKAEAALRIPEGAVNTGASIYQSVADLAKHWPADGRARSALVVSDGLDINRGLSETLPMLNPDLNEAIRQAQKAGVTIYTLYAGGAARLTHNLFLLNNGQSMLTRLADETGGEAYFQGNQTPVSFAPFLDRLHQALSRQYILTFDAAPKAEEARLRVSTELPHVAISAPAEVWVGK